MEIENLAIRIIKLVRKKKVGVNLLDVNLQHQHRIQLSINARPLNIFPPLLN